MKRRFFLMTHSDLKRAEKWIEDHSLPGRTISSLVRGWSVRIDFEPGAAGAALFRLATTSPWTVLGQQTFAIWESAFPSLDPEDEIDRARGLIEQYCPDQQCEIDWGVEVEFAFRDRDIMAAFEAAFFR